MVIGITPGPSQYNTDPGNVKARNQSPNNRDSGSGPSYKVADLPAASISPVKLFTVDHILGRPSPTRVVCMYSTLLYDCGWVDRLRRV